MKNEELKVEMKIPYQFTASPLNLMYIMDSDCFKMLNLLIQEESYWRSQGKLVNGYFFKSINELKEDMFISNDQDVRLTIEALYSNGLIDVIYQGNMHKASNFKINMEKVMEYNAKTITDVKKFAQRICKLPRKSTCTYMNRNDSTPKQDVKVDTKCNTDCIPESTPKLDKSYSLNKSNLLNNLDCLNNINNKIINNENFEKETFHSVINNIEKKELGKVDINNQQISDASTPQVDAQHIVPTENKITNEDSLLNKFMEDYKKMEIDQEALYQILNQYPIDDIKYIEKMLPTLHIPNNNVTGYIKYLIGLDSKKLRLSYNNN